MTTTIWRALGVLAAGGTAAFGALLAHDFKTNFARFAKRSPDTRAER